MQVKETPGFFCEIAGFIAQTQCEIKYTAPCYFLDVVSSLIALPATKQFFDIALDPRLIAVQRTFFDDTTVSSMVSKVGILVSCEDLYSGNTWRVCKAFATFVARPKDSGKKKKKKKKKKNAA
ncbi:UNVERIFIED_CONTAM: hypothetical protein FKN15_026878 [Acipenser sinensis]